jgi:small GTP-binding protein
MSTKDKYCIVVLGPGGVGKTCITLGFVKGNFVERYDPTIEDSYSVKTLFIKPKTLYNFENKTYKVDVLDTAGQDEYGSLRDTCKR